MVLRVLREPTAQGATLGALYVDDVWTAWTLEDPLREVPGRPVSEWKLPGATAIPEGHYRVTLYFSPKAQRTVLLLHDVPGFTMVEVHVGNKPEDTDGCLLVGLRRAADGGSIQDSRLALEKLLPAVQEALGRGEPVWADVYNPWSASVLLRAS